MLRQDSTSQKLSGIFPVMIGLPKRKADLSHVFLFIYLFFLSLCGSQGVLNNL